MPYIERDEMDIEMHSQTHEVKGGERRREERRERERDENKITLESGHGQHFRVHPSFRLTSPQRAFGLYISNAYKVTVELRGNTKQRRTRRNALSHNRFSLSMFC